MTREDKGASPFIIFDQSAGRYQFLWRQKGTVLYKGVAFVLRLKILLEYLY